MRELGHTCPFLNRECAEEYCVFWFTSEGNCAIRIIAGKVIEEKLFKDDYFGGQP